MTTLDPFLKQSDIEVQPEERLEPDLIPPEPGASRQARLRYRLSHYGNRVLASGSKFLITTGEAINNIGTALAGSIILLPLVIVVRGVSVLTKGFLDWLKPFVLSAIRLFFEALHAAIYPIRAVFGNFNKHILFPLLKRIREDDASALIAFVLLLALVGGVIYLIAQLL